MRLNLVSYILSDKDVDGFIRPIFLQFQQGLENDAYSMFVDALGLPSERQDASGRVMLSRSERDAYNDFVQGLMSNIRSRDFDSSILRVFLLMEDPFRCMKEHFVKCSFFQVCSQLDLDQR